MLKFRNEREDIYAQQSPTIHTKYVDGSHMGGKVLVMDNVIYVANFSNTASTTTIDVPESGKWRNLMTGEEVNIGMTHEVTLEPNDYIILVR